MPEIASAASTPERRLAAPFRLPAAAVANVAAHAAAPPPIPRARARSRTARDLALLAPGIGGFAALLVLVRARRTEALDLAITLRLQAIDHPLLELAMRAVSWPGFPPQSRLIPPAAALGLWLARARTESALTLLAWTSGLTSEVIKRFMDRPRPVAGTDLRVVAADLGGTSFPSGHTLTYTVVYGWLAVVADLLIRRRWVRRPVLAGLAALVAGIGPSRIHLGHHWPSDVLASYLLGASHLAGLVLLERRLRTRPVAR
ncbi:MAG: phosphatase PAP2 family protein [Chloroflexota bacterium]